MLIFRLKFSILLLVYVVLPSGFSNPVFEFSEQVKTWQNVEEYLEQTFSAGRPELLLFELGLLIGDYKIDLSSNEFKNVSALLDVIKSKGNILKNGRTLLETARLTDVTIQFPLLNTLPQIIKEYDFVLSDVPEKDQTWKYLENKILSALNRALNFYETHLDEILKSDAVVALLFLKDIDNKHGKKLQGKFPLEKWIDRVCETARRNSQPEGDFCSSLVQHWNKSSRNYKKGGDTWQSAQIIMKIINQTEDKILENIGNEKDGLWGTLNGQCQMAIVNRCEVPYVCERTLLDPTPRSQYLLTHQLLQRLFVDTVDCPNTKSFVTEHDTYTNLCAKMYMEAKYLDALKVPILQRDLFAEYVGFCGYLGYTNFLREDWLDMIISWQSKSNHGCFLKDPLSPVGILTTDVGFKRKATKQELDKGIQESGEKCLPHFTAVGLMALSAHWDYMMDLKANK